MKSVRIVNRSSKTFVVRDSYSECRGRVEQLLYSECVKSERRFDPAEQPNPFPSEFNGFYAEPWDSQVSPNGLVAGLVYQEKHDPNHAGQHFHLLHWTGPCSDLLKVDNHINAFLTIEHWKVQDMSTGLVSNRAVHLDGDWPIVVISRPDVPEIEPQPDVTKPLVCDLTTNDSQEIAQCLIANLDRERLLEVKMALEDHFIPPAPPVVGPSEGEQHDNLEYKKAQRQARLSKRKQGSNFGRGGCFTCTNCGKKTRVVPATAGYSDPHLCGFCFEEAGLENSLSDGNIDQETFDSQLADLRKKYKK
jgi:hypothetical protein